MSIREKGKAYERKLVKLLQNYGWKSRRVPASILDVIATKNDRIVVFEVKATKENSIKVEKEQIQNLVDWLSLFDYYPKREAVIAVRFKGQKWIFKKVDEIKDYKITIDDISDWVIY
jgi:Holliday junction resolvase